MRLALAPMSSKYATVYCFLTMTSTEMKDEDDEKEMSPWWFLKEWPEHQAGIEIASIRFVKLFVLPEGPVFRQILLGHGKFWWSFVRYAWPVDVGGCWMFDGTLPDVNEAWWSVGTWSRLPHFIGWKRWWCQVYRRHVLCAWFLRCIDAACPDGAASRVAVTEVIVDVTALPLLQELRFSERIVFRMVPPLGYGIWFLGRNKLLWFEDYASGSYEPCKLRWWAEKLPRWPSHD